MPAKNDAFLIGISQYAGYTLRGVANDVALLRRGLRHHRYPPQTIHRLGAAHMTLSELQRHLAALRSAYEQVESGTCLVYVGASGALSLDPLQAGVLPSDGQDETFDTALSWPALGAYLPVRAGLRVTVILDT